MSTQEQNTTLARIPGMYFVSWHHSTEWFVAQWLGEKWVVNDEDGHPYFHKDADFDFIDERRVVHLSPLLNNEKLEYYNSVLAKGYHLLDAENERLKEAIDVALVLLVGYPTSSEAAMAYTHLNDTRYQKYSAHE